MTMVDNTRSLTDSPLRWYIPLGLIATILIFGTLLIAALAFGLADPPNAQTLLWQQDQPDNWRSTQTGPDIILDHAPARLPTVFTLELVAHNPATDNSAWGFTLDSDPRIVVLIDSQGYLSTTDPPQWAAFHHIRPGEANTLYLNVDSRSVASLRINGEIARQWDHIETDSWSIARFQNPRLVWNSLKLYGN